VKYVKPRGASKLEKAAGPDSIPAESINLSGDSAIALIYDICCAAWKTGSWPEDWMNSTFVPILKKGDVLTPNSCTHLAR